MSNDQPTGDTPAPGLSAADGRLDEAATGSLVIPLIEESLRVDKRLVETSGLRITKQVATHDETVDEPLRNQRFELERRVIGQVLPTLDAPSARQEGDTWVIPILKEVLVTEKRLLLVEEVRITRIDGTYHDPQQVTLRSESVTVERLEPRAPDR